MQSHIGCICLTFLHSAFSNVSSKRLAQKRHSRIGCIYLIFPHSAFSNVSSKRLHKMMQSHIGCICLTFVHCAFSNVSSKCLHKTHNQLRVAIECRKGVKVKVVKWCWKKWNGPILMHIYAKQCEIMQKNRWKRSNGQIHCFCKGKSAPWCWKHGKLGKLKRELP